MIADAVGVIRSVVREELRGFRTAELGVVSAAYSRESASDASNYECDVTLRDSGLELKRVPVATNRIGAVARPNPGDLVVILYLNGSPASAIILAGSRLYNDVDRPPEAKQHEYVYVSPDPEESGIRRIHLALPRDNLITLEDEQLVLQMGSTSITVKNGGDVVIDSDAEIRIAAAGDVSVEAGGNLELSAGGDVTVEGVNTSVKAQASATVQGSASATLKAGTISIAGQTSFSPG